MNQRIIVCIDGTWNGPGQTDTDPLHETEVITETNVALTWECLTGKTITTSESIAPLAGQSGHAMYLSGVGYSDEKSVKIIEGATGIGLSKRIIDAYMFLASHWRRGDRIAMFGFSRGAFAVRSLCSFIDRIGLPQLPSVLDRSHIEMALMSCNDEKSAFSRPTDHVNVQIDFFGLWDTVAGLPFDRLYGHSINPCNVAHVCHALALDERRGKFSPKFFEKTDHRQKVEEVWFCGAHSNVGGGYVDSTLSGIALSWVLDRANQTGLKIPLNQTINWHPSRFNQLIRDSCQDFYRRVPLPDELLKIVKLEGPRKMLPGQRIHASVKEAMTHGYQVGAQYETGAHFDYVVESW